MHPDDRCLVWRVSRLSGKAAASAVARAITAKVRGDAAEARRWLRLYDDICETLSCDTDGPGLAFAVSRQRAASGKAPALVRVPKARGPRRPRFVWRRRPS